MKRQLPSEFVTELLQMLRNQFYVDSPKLFYQQRRFLIRAITWPAKCLVEQGVWLTETRYRRLIMDRVLEIKRHGTQAEIRFFGGYFLNIIQKHMAHHGHEYYEEGKQARTAVDQALSVAKTAQARDLEAEGDTVSTLAEFNSLVGRKPLRKKNREPDNQLPLL